MDQRLDFSYYCKELDLISPNLDFKNEEAFLEEARQTLPRMTAFFIEEMFVRSSGIPARDRLSAYRSARNRIASRQKIQEFPIADAQAGSQKILPLPFPPRYLIPVEHEWHREKVVRTLIKGLSDHFNDLMMGIWGNISLIRILLPQDHQAFERVLLMERMIQEGAYLIQLILGYLAERRSVGKTVRLNQLIHHMACYSPKDQDHKQLAERLHRGTKSCQPGLIASATARIIELLLKGIDIFRRNIVPVTLDTPAIQQRIGVIAALVKKGEMITSQLLCYAGDIQLKKKSTNIKSIIDRQYRHACERFSHVHIAKTVTPRLPRMTIDPENTEWVVAQLIENAANVLPPGGRLGLTLKPLYAEDPGERCGVRGGMDYIVISVEDNGPGIDTHQGLDIFNPFCTLSKTKHAIGLGLAAANGIIRKQKGYIQFRSKPEQGSCFKIYLPVSGGG